MKSGALSLLLLSASIAASTALSSQDTKVEESARSLKKKKSKKKSKKDPPLVADMKTLDEDGDFPDISGWISLEYDDDDMLVIDYDLTDAPERCGDCKLAIYDGWSCDYLYDPHFKKDKYAEDDGNPWSAADTPYITNKDGKAAGHMKVDSGIGYSGNECKFFVLYDTEDDGDDDDYDYDDDYWRNRKLHRTSEKRAFGRQMKKKSKKSDKPSKIACGMLIPEGKDESYC